MGNAFAHTQLLEHAARCLQQGDPAGCLQLLARAGDAFQDDARWHALRGLALLLQQQGAEAVAALERSLALQPDDFEVANNLAVARAQLGEVPAARDLLLHIVERSPRDARALANVASIELRLKEIDAAIQHARAALCLQPADVGIMTTLAAALARRGEYEEAIELSMQVLQRDPANVESAFNELQSRMALGQFASVAARVAFLTAQAYLPKVAVRGLAILRAIAAVADHRVDEAEESLTQAGHLPEGNYPSQRILEAYYRFLVAIVRVRGELPSLHADRELYLLGDSHCLTAAYATLSTGVEGYRLIPRLVMGAKAWHLRANQENRFTRTLGVMLDRIPSGSQVIAQFGEIDCRPDEGIYPRMARGEADGPVMVHETASGYVAGLCERTRDRDLKLAICGVPAPRREILPKGSAAAEQFVAMVREFNRALVAAAQAAHLPFVDLYAKTADPSGIALPGVHVDEVHLHPKVFLEALMTVL